MCVGFSHGCGAHIPIAHSICPSSQRKPEGKGQRLPSAPNVRLPSRCFSGSFTASATKITHGVAGLQTCRIQWDVEGRGRVLSLSMWASARLTPSISNIPLSLHLLLLLLLLPGGGGDESQDADHLPSRVTGQLGFAIMSPLPGEWVNHKAFTVTIEAWSVHREDFDFKLWIDEQEVYAARAPDGER